MIARPANGDTAGNLLTIDDVIPAPGLCEVDTIELALPLDEAWEVVRHADLADSALIRGLFALRTLPSRIGRRAHDPFTVRIDDLVSTAAHPGFGVLVDDRPREVVVGAIGKVWQADIEFVHVADAATYRAFAEPGFARVAWALRLTRLGPDTTQLDFELRVDATDAEAWQRFRHYFRVIGPASRFIRHRLLSELARRHGTERAEHAQHLPGDELLPDAADQLTHGITIGATPAQIWPWLVQMGCRRGGFYSIDLFDNAGRRSAREIHPELQQIRVGDIVAATPDGDDGFEVLRAEPNQVLVLGGLYDPDAAEQLRFSDERPERYWQVTWAFVLHPRADGTTRLVVRARAAHDPSKRFHARWIRPVHHLMQRAQLRNLAARAEGSAGNDDWRDVATGVGGAAVIAAALFTPFLRPARSHWGVDAATAEGVLPGDDLVAEPRWQWTHGIEIDAPADAVWPWVAQIGADRAGFYSYQWLENIPGCDVRNAETIHDEWAAKSGDGLLLHPKMPALPIVHVEPGRCLVAHAAPATGADRGHGPWADASWMFLVEPLGDERCRVISRYRVATSDDFRTRLQFGPVLLEPIGFAMDRRMLLGIKERAERANAPR